MNLISFKIVLFHYFLCFISCIVYFEFIVLCRLRGHVARMEDGRSAFKILTGKPTGKRPFRRPRGRWEDNIRMYQEPPGSISHGIS